MFDAVSIGWSGKFLKEPPLSVTVKRWPRPPSGTADAPPIPKTSPRSGSGFANSASVRIGSTSTMDSGTNRVRPGLDQALAALREGDTLVVPKLDRLARSVPDARAIGDDLAARGIKLSLGGQVYDPTDPMGKLFFNILATFAESRLTCCACGPEKAWPSPGRKVASKAENPSYPTNNGRSCDACAPPATTPSPTSPNCSTSPDPPSTAPSQPWKLFLHNPAADNASTYWWPGPPNEKGPDPLRC